MADHPQATIRRYDDAKDEKLLQFAVGKAVFSGLAVANREVYLSPFWLAAWIALGSAMVALLDWTPNPAWGAYGYLRPVPAFAATFVPLIFAVDWQQRPHFEDRTNAVLTAEDMRNARTHYAAPGRGLWLLDLGTTFVGLVALDRETPANTQATVRHLYVEEQFRPARAQDDLLAHALRTAFVDPTVRSVRLAGDGVQRYVDESAARLGMTSVERGEPFGLHSWRAITWEITREAWEVRAAGAAAEK